MSFRVLGDIVKIKGGKRLPKSSQLQVIKNDHPYIRVRDMGERYLPRNGLEYVPDNVFPSISRYIVNTNDLILSIVGTVGLVSIVDEYFNNASLTENCVKLTGLDEKDAKYLYYYLLSQYGKEEIKARTVGAVQPKLPLYNIEKIQIRWFDKLIREKIVTCLSTLDDKIQLNNQTNQTLESIAQAIFKSWFIDFEPVRAKIAAKQNGEDPEIAAMCVISGKSEEDLKKMAEEDFAELQATAALFPDELVESELGEVPRGWEVEKLSQNIDVLNGYAFKSKAYIKEGIFVLRTKNFNNGLVEGLTDDVYLPKIFLEEYPNYICEPYDYHMVMVGASIGDTGLIFPSMLPALRNQNMWCFRAKNSSDFGKSYTKLLLDSLIYETLGFASGSAREFFRKGDFQDKRVCVPSKKLLRRFEKIGFSCMQKQSIIFAENYYLKKIRDTLLPKLLSGEIDVSALQDEVA